MRTKTLSLHTQGFTDIINITTDIQDFIDENTLENNQKNGINNGLVSVFVQGSTGAVTVIEYEPNLVEDFKNAMERIAPSDIEYEHKKTWNDDNGFSHVRASVVGCSETIPFVSGALMLGTWQQVVVVDFDNTPRERKIVLSILEDNNCES